MRKPKTNSKTSQRGQRAEKPWLPSLLLLAQFLTITPVLLIVFADEQQRKASDGYATVLDGLDQLSFTIADLESIPRPGGKQDAAWRQQYSEYRGDMDRVLAASATTPQVRETLARVDSLVATMADSQSDLAELRKDGRAARSELLNAQRSVRTELSTTGDSIAQKTTYLKALVAGACLLAFGVVFVVRRFRVDAAIQGKLQRDLRTANEEVIAALAVARSESEAKNRFVAHVGRLMRTPLNALVDKTGELLATDLTGRQRDSARANLELAESLLKISGQVDDYSKMESGRFELQSREFDPARVVSDVLQLFLPLAERKGLKLKSSIAKGLPSAVRGDRKRLRQVLVNVLSNAVQFTDEGEVSLRVDAAAGEERTSLRFEVKDTGIGITEEIRNRIFQPFNMFQPASVANGSTHSGANQGSGLSLAISKKLVELMGGKIEIASEPGRGATFSFTVVFESVRGGAEHHHESGHDVSSVTEVIVAANAKPRSEKKERPDRRLEPRHGTNYPTLLRAENAGVAVIRVLDVSPSGLRLSVPFRLLPRTEVEIRIEGTSVVGVVRNCTRITPNEFHVGIQIPWEASADEQDRLNHLHLLRIELT